MMDRRRARRAPGRFGGAFARLALAGFVLAGLAMAVFARDAGWVGDTRSAVDDQLSPGQRVAGAPFAAVRRASDYVSELARIQAENERLRAENEELRAWYDLAQAMVDKMQRYERLLNVVPDPEADFVHARMVAETAGPFVRGRLLNAGEEVGVAPGQAALSERGLVGRVVTAGRRSARVLLLTDLNSRVPVMADRSDVRAILSGDNTDNPRLEFLPRGHGLREGDRIVTSGDAGQLPRGLAVGVAYNDPDGVWRVRLYSADAPVDYVRIVRFAFPAAPEDELALEEVVAEAAPETETENETEIGAAEATDDGEGEGEGESAPAPAPAASSAAEPAGEGE